MSIDKSLFELGDQVSYRPADEYPEWAYATVIGWILNYNGMTSRNEYDYEIMTFNGERLQRWQSQLRDRKIEILQDRIEQMVAI